VASGTAPLSYQWKRNNVNVPGGTSATLNLNGVASGDAGSYTCTVGNSAGSVTSSAATLTVNAAPVVPTIRILTPPKFSLEHVRAVTAALEQQYQAIVGHSDYAFDLEKALYGSPAIDLAHCSLYTSTTWDIAASRHRVHLFCIICYMLS